MEDKEFWFQMRTLESDQSQKEKITHTFNEVCINLEGMTVNEILLVLEWAKRYSLNNARLLMQR